MKYSASLLAVSALPLIVNAHLAARASQSSDGADDSICYPKSSDGDVTAPCVEINNIASACQPNGTEPLAYEAHAQCMCNGSYFEDWVGCQKCLVAHGFRNERDIIHYENVLTAASNGLCTGTPTAAFQSYFASAESNSEAAGYATTGDTVSSDKFPGKTAVSLYYSPTASQGPGAITGSAASATHKAPATTHMPNSSSGGDNSNINSSTYGSDSSTEASHATNHAHQSHTTNAAAAPTQQAGLAMAVAGAALIFAA